jgi:hypothetical protein
MKNVISQAPDHLLKLIEQVKAHYIEVETKRKRGHPRTYSGLSFLLLSVVGVTLRTFKGLELQRLLKADIILREAMCFETVPHRRTIERRLASLQEEAEGQVAAFGKQIVEEIEVPDGLPKAASIDGRMYKSVGPLWHQKQRKQGVIPLGLRNVDEESKWSKSGYRGWIQGYRLVLETLIWSVPIPLYASWNTNDRFEGDIFQAAIDEEQIVFVELMLGDSHFGAEDSVSKCGENGCWLLTPKQLPKCYKTFKNDLYAMRKESIELLFQRIIQAFDLKNCPTKTLKRNGAFVIASVWVYQIICWSNYKQNKPIANVKETIDLARWRVPI